MENWIGAGSAGSGTIINEKIDEKIDGGEGAPAPGSGGPGGRRTSYAPDAGAFTEDPSRCLRTEDLERDTVLRETIMMGFRYRGGPDPALFLRRFGQTIEETIPQTLARWSAFLRPGKTALSEEGLLFLNRFTLDAFGELDASRRNGGG
jgi:oxygen-independent coproporphyrinogen-3 oxidase